VTTVDLCHQIIGLVEDGADSEEIRAFCEEHLEGLDRFSVDEEELDDEELVFQSGLEED